MNIQSELDTAIKDQPPSDGARTRRFSGLLENLVSAISVLLAIHTIVYVSTLYDVAGISLFGSNRALVFSGIIFLLYMLFPASTRGPWNYVPGYDWLLALGGVITSLYAFYSWDQWSYAISLPTWQEEIAAVVLIVVSLEAARRVLGLAFTAVGLVFVLYPMLGQYIPGIMATPPYTLSQLTQFFFLAGGGSGIFGAPMEIFTTTVAVFLLLGAFLDRSGAARIFIDAALAVAGRFRGGMAKVAVVSSGLFGLISGVGAANVLVTGSFTIPAMKRLGYRPSFAGAVEASASTGGILMPPVMGAAAFLMADILNVSYWSVAYAALLPGVLYYVAMFTMVDFLAGRANLAGLPAKEVPQLRGTLLRGWYLIASITALMVAMGYFRLPVDQSALLAIIVLNVLAVGARKLSIRALRDSLDAGGRMIAEIGAAGAVVGIIISGFSLTGLGAFLPTAMQTLAGNSLLPLLIISAIASIILGMGAPPLLVYVLLASTVVPPIIKLGVEPIAAHMFIFYFGLLSMLTPPVALSSLIAARLAGAGFWETSLEACRLSIVAFVLPFFFVYQPALLLIGDAIEVTTAVATALIGVVGLSGGLTRFLFVREISRAEALLLVLGGFMLLYPEHYSDVAGLIMVLPSLGYSGIIWYRDRRSASGSDR